ncbi:hypothetical protein [Sphingobium sp. KCTC 72723]|uniref:hypothetical protein n=1 Tax=Sphingobium sp. KCTC 72723 TaxID=2733867 RepID=UPI00165E5380|nr:hypothetical protein [Sphingobium sp. KCTC 72723]
MAKKKPTETFQTVHADTLYAAFKSPKMAELFGVTIEDFGIVTITSAGFMTVEFENATAENLSVDLFELAPVNSVAEPELPFAQEGSDHE